MTSRARLATAASAAGLLVLSLALLGLLPAAGPARAGETAAATAGFAGSQACRSCHPVPYRAWSQASHALTFLEASADTLPEDVLAERTVDHAPGRTRFHVVEGDGQTRYQAETLDADGEPHPFPLTHVVGRIRVRMYLTQMPDGRLQVLPAMLEEPTGRWFDYTKLIFGTGNPEDAPVVEPGDASFWTGPVRSFDARCSRCHVSGRSVEPPPVAGGPAPTTWRARGVDCEMCHGPSEAHVQHQDGMGGMDDILPLASLGRDRHVSLCLRCHLEGEVVAGDMPPGVDVLEHVNPTLLDDSERVDAFGRPLELIYDGLPFLASTCAREGGLTCITCHDPHGSDHASQLRAPPRDDALCASCHEDVAAAGTAHTHHPADGWGGRCVDCHMPFLTIERGHGAVADHTISIPRLDAPGDRVATDACTWCHEGRRRAPEDVPALEGDALAAAFAAWWPDPAPPHAWEQAVADARAGVPGAREALLAVLADPATPRVYRATAVRLLAREAATAPEATRDVLLLAALDADSLVRREAAGGLAGLRGPEVDRALLDAMDDASAAVRGKAARAALEGWSRVQASAELLARVIAILEEEAAAVPDDDLRWFRLAAARELAGDRAGAIDAYARQVALDPFAGNVRGHLETLRAETEASDEAD